MRIAYLSGAHIPSRGANAVHVMRMCQAMARLGHEVTLHARPAGENAKGTAGSQTIAADDDFAFYGVERCFRIEKQPRPDVRVWGAFASAWRTRRAVLAGPRPDLIYVREVWSLALVADLGIPYVFESHWAPSHLPAWQRAMERALLKRADCVRVVLISEALRTIYSLDFPWLEASRTVVCHDGADAVPATTTPRPVLGRRGALQVGYIGSFWPGYGVDVVEALARRMPHVDFHIVGGDPSQVATHQTSTAGVPNLRYHGFVAPSALPAIYADLDVALAPYQAGTAHIGWISPMKLFEYMAHGKAIVCSNFPVMAEIVEDGATGLLVEPASVDAWVGAVERLADADVRARMGTAARTRLEDEFTWNTRASRALRGLDGPLERTP